MSLRSILTGLWTLLAITTATYALLKASPTANDLVFLPAPWAQWLDYNYDLRTLLMTLAVLLPAALLLGRRSHSAQRRVYLILVTAGLLALEFVQIGIPTRDFGLPDLLYTVVGGILAEGAGWSVQTIDDNFRT